MDDKLIKFLSIVENRGFSQASKVLRISQPALSVAIKKLEKELGTELLIRDGRTIRLTKAGKAVYASALQISTTVSNLHSKLDSLSQRRPSIAIGMVDSVAIDLCSSIAFDRLEESCNVNVVVDSSRVLYDMVNKRQIDTAFVINDNDEHPNLSKHDYCTEQMIAVCAPNLQYDTQKRLEVGWIDNLICYDKKSITYRLITNHLHGLNISFQDRLLSTSPSVLLEMTKRGKGVAILPERLSEPMIDSGELSCLRLDTGPLLVPRPIIRIEQRNVQHHAVLGEYLKSITSNQRGK